MPSICRPVPAAAEAGNWLISDKFRPMMSAITESTNPLRGPATARSNSARLSFGIERMLINAPMVPNRLSGIGMK